MASETHILDDLNSDDCRRLLEIASIGRVGFTQGALPRIRPVHFTMRNNEVIVGTAQDSSPVAGDRGQVVVFEADSYNPATGEGWCVTMIGATRSITDTTELRELDAMHFAPWAAEQGRYYFAIPMDLIQGRRLCRQGGAALGA